MLENMLRIFFFFMPENILFSGLRPRWWGRVTKGRWGDKAYRKISFASLRSLTPSSCWLHHKSPPSIWRLYVNGGFWILPPGWSEGTPSRREPAKRRCKVGILFCSFSLRGIWGKRHRSVMMGGFRVLDNINLPCWRVVEGGGSGAWYQYLASPRSLLFLSTYLSGATVTRATHVTSPTISLPS